ncbi:MAG: hypothetical protein VX498_07280 [Myxococcota bacterium]|nr:hypothetical protein [Myxococcota bacterium]
MSWTPLSENPQRKPAEAVEPPPPIESLKWVTWSRWSLWFCGACYLLLGPLLATFLGAIVSMDPSFNEEAGLMATRAFAIGVGAIGVVVGALNFIVAAGLKRGRKWAWFGAIILGGTYAPSGCLPFGVLLLYAMFQKDVRRAFRV